MSTDQNENGEIQAGQSLAKPSPFHLFQTGFDGYKQGRDQSSGVVE